MSKQAVTSDWIEITPDLRAWLAKPEGANSPPGVLLYIEAYGVTAHMRAVAERYAAAGYVAIVPDIYHGRVFEYDDKENVMATLRSLDDRQVMRESATTLDRLIAEGASGKSAVVGYCMGGRLAFLAGLELGERLSTAVSYYGGGIGPEQDRFGRTPLIERADELGPPILLHYGGKDQSIAPAEHARVAAALSNAGKRYTMSVYPEAGHGFNCDERPSYDNEAAAEAWELTQTFLAHHRSN
ncbi:MAG: dienelactone hydrolase family protein [Gammaproteobacteria bacterium]